MKPLSPLLFPHHPFGTKPLADRHLPAMTDVFAPLGAPRGDAIGLELKLMLVDSIPISLAPARILMSGGAGAQPTSVGAAELLGREDLIGPLQIALNAPFLCQDMAAQWNMIPDFRWADSSYGGEYNLRTLWAFSDVAVLLDNIKAHEMREDADLRWLAAVCYERPSSRHGVMTRLGQLNEVLHLASEACVPQSADEWPLDAPQDHIPFRNVTPSDIQLTNGLFIAA